MSKTQEALKLALEALEEINQRSVSREHAQLISENAITAIREALAQPEQEPVAIIASLKLEERRALLDEGFSLHDALYTTPPQRKPLTDEQVREICEGSGYDKATMQERADFINGIRHAEAAHGIKEKNI